MTSGLLGWQFGRPIARGRSASDFDSDDLSSGTRGVRVSLLQPAAAVGSPPETIGKTLEKEQKQCGR
jgi:hypothetical protein